MSLHSMSVTLFPVRSRRRGVALMMSLVTLFLLISVSVPYVLMTGHQEAGALAFSDQIEAKLGAQSALDLTLARLRESDRVLQFERWAYDQEVYDSTITTPWERSRNNPFVDPFYEREIDLARDIEESFGPITVRPARGAVTWKSDVATQPFSPVDPRRQVWSSYVEDEQGKININAATPTLIGNILGSGIVTSAEGMSNNCTLQMDAEDAQSFSEGGGHFVLGSYLCSYQQRAFGTFYNVHIGAPYQNPYGGLKDVCGDLFRVIEKPFSVDTRFQGHLALPLVAYLVVAQRLISDQAQHEPWRYASVDQMRSVAEMEVLRPGEASLDDAFDPVIWLSTRDLFTVYSHGPFDGGFFDPRVISAVYDFDNERPRSAFVAEQSRFEVMDTEWLAPHDPRRQTNRRSLPAGVIGRLRYPDGQDAYGLCSGMNVFASPYTMDPEIVRYTNGIETERPILEVQELAPINLNTASWDVLVANVKGLRQGESVVTRSDAEAFAAAIQHVLYDEFAPVNPRYRSLDDMLGASDPEYYDSTRPMQWGRVTSLEDLQRILSALVSDGVIPDYVQALILDHQRYPYLQRAVTTAPFCFHSYGAVSVRAHAQTFAGIGIERGRARIHEVIDLGADGPVEWEWRDESVLLEEAQRPQGNAFVQRFSRTEGARRLSQASAPWLLDPEALVASGEGTLKVDEATYINPLSINNAKAFYTANSVNNVDLGTGLAGGQTQVADMQSGMLRFWYKLPAGFVDNQDSYIFDVGEGQYTNRMSLLWWGGGRRAGRLANEPPGLTFRVKDRTLEEAFTAIHLDVDPERFRADNWYHVNVGFNGEEASEVSLFVDGVAERGEGEARTDHVFRDPSTGAWVARSSRLTADLPPELGNPGLGGATTDVIAIESADYTAFPDSGVIRIGEEAIYYDTKALGGFTDLVRGVRGTRAPQIGEDAYPAGSSVTVFGYDVVIEEDDTTPFLPRGGARLASDLEGNGFYRVIGGNGGGGGNYYAEDVIGPDAGFSSTTNFLPLDDMTGIPQCGVFYIAGLCWKGYAADPASGQLMPDHEGDGVPDLTINPNGAVMTQSAYFDAEYIVFTRSTNGVQVVERYDAGFNPKAPQDYYSFMGSWEGVAPSDTLSTNPGYWMTSGSVCLLVSVQRDIDGFYHDPQTQPVATSRIQIDHEWLEYNRLLSYQNHHLFVYTFGNAQYLGGRAVNAAQTYVASLTDPNVYVQGINGFRELDGSGNSLTHLAGLEITPTFRIQGNRAGAGDRVTVLQSPNAQKQARVITRVETRGWNHPTGAHQIVAFGSNVPVDYFADESEVLKFPADPLPRGIPTQIRFGGAYYAGVARDNLLAAEVDEVVFDTWTDQNLTLARDVVVTERDEISVLQQQGSLPDVGLVKIDDELIAYRSLEEEQLDLWLEFPENSGNWQLTSETTMKLTGISRGVLGTEIRAHTRGVGLMLVQNQPVAVLSGSITQADSQFEIDVTNNFPIDKGFLRLERRGSGGSRINEVFAYTHASPSTQPGRFTLYGGDYHPVNTPALFRGSYGTEAQAWDSDAIIVAQPVREPDLTPGWMRGKDAEMSASPEVAFLQGSQTFHNARLKRLRWLMDLPTTHRTGDFMGAKLYVRFNGEPEWSGEPQVEGPLYAFDFDWARAERVDDGLLEVLQQVIEFDQILDREIDRIEWRLIYYYRAGAFDADSWKGTLRFKGLIAELDSEMKVLSHEVTK